ncbi:unnamed protein product, partial [Ectocarpus sp. 13 AM-2016]
RFRVSLSPATGLVGMEENVFLSDLFGCVGFLPLTTKSHIRETMVETMTAPAPLQQPAIAGNWDEETRFSEIERGVNCSKASDVNQFRINPQSCTFWCAIALGAVAKGHPVESVEKYSQLAQEALPKSASGPADAEVAKAWAMLAYLSVRFHGRLGEDLPYLPGCVGVFLLEFCRNGCTGTLPVGFAEVVKFTEISDSCCGQRQTNWSIGDEQAMAQLNEAAPEGEIYWYVAQSLKAFEQSSYAIANEQTVKTGEAPCEIERDGRPNRARPSERALLPTEISNAMSTLIESGGCTEFGPLQEVIDGRGMRGGVGSLLVNTNLVLKRQQSTISMPPRRELAAALRFSSGILACAAAPWDTTRHIWCWSGSQRLTTPDLERCTTGCAGHTIHYAVLARGPYPCWRSGTEWLLFCDDSYCRAIENIITSEHFTAMVAPSVDGIDVCDGAKGTGNCKGEAAQVGRWQAQGEKLSVCNIPPKVADSACDRPTESGAERGSGLTVVSKSPIATPVSSQSACTQSKAGLIPNGVENGTAIVAMAPESFPRSSEVGEGQCDLTNDTEDDGPAAEDWLDVTFAMLRAL